MCWKIYCFFYERQFKQTTKIICFLKVVMYLHILEFQVLHPGFRVGEPIYTAGGEVVGGGLIHGQLA